MISEEIRRFYGLPITKTIYYYPNIHKNEKKEVISIKEQKFYLNWSDLDIVLSDGSKVTVHSSHLREMQKPSW